MNLSPSVIIISGMHTIFFWAVVAWPLVTVIMAIFFHRKQNGTAGWTGGPISKPKSMWLSFTVCNWFFLPAWLLLAELVPQSFRPLYLFHLLSWWIRGPLELIMIYKWLNWSPRYGISHDIFHLLVCATLLIFGVHNGTGPAHPNFTVAAAFGLAIIISTGAETWFAWLFLQTRSAQEQKENVYFASEDPKWIFINRATASVVYPMYAFLFAQSVYLVFGKVF